jgi:hypothetical protein
MASSEWEEDDYECMVGKNLEGGCHDHFQVSVFPTWEEHRLRVFENRVLRRIFRPKRDEVTGGWRKLHNEELHNLYCSPNIIMTIKSRRMRLERRVARIGETRNAF